MRGHTGGVCVCLFGQMTAQTAVACLFNRSAILGSAHSPCNELIISMSASITPPSPQRSISVTCDPPHPIILTLSLLPLLFSNRVSMRMLNLERNDTCRGDKRQKNKQKASRTKTEGTQAAD